MNTTTTFAAIAVAASLGTAHLQADDPIFEVSTFIAGIEGDGFVGNQDTGEGLSWEFPGWPDMSSYIYDIADLPIEYQAEETHPLGGLTTATAHCSGEVTETGVELTAYTTASVGVQTGGDPSLFADSFAQVHGEYHLTVNEASMLEYSLCGETIGSVSGIQLYIRKLVSGNWQTLIQLIVNDANNPLECIQGEFPVEPGYYQVYFASVVTCNNDSVMGGIGVEDVGSAFLAYVDFSPLPSIADINGDGKVDGTDLGRLLGAWGSSAGGGDLNGDGTVDGKDLAILLSEWTG